MAEIGEGRIEMDGEGEHFSRDRDTDHGGAPSRQARGGGQAGTRQVARRSALESTIIREIVPRLLLAHAPEAVEPRPTTGPQPLLPDVAHLVGLVLAPDLDAATAFVMDRHGAGLSVEAVYLDLLAPVARHLGWLWEEDLCDFTRVTLALGQLHHLVRAFGGEAAVRDCRHRVLFVPAPGDHHTLGLAMVTELFRRDGWPVWSGTPDGVDELLDLVRREWFAIVGLSLGSDGKLDALAQAIRRLRRASRNRALGVMVGGPLFVARPELVAMVGADATATDGRHALRQARALLTLLGRAA